MRVQSSSLLLIEMAVRHSMCKTTYHQQGIYALVFGLGLTCSFFLPTRFILGMIALIVILLSISLIKC